MTAMSHALKFGPSFSHAIPGSSVFLSDVPFDVAEIIGSVLADAYKLGHHMMYPDGLTKMQGNVTPRSFKRFKGSKYYDNTMVVAGVTQAVQSIYNAWSKFFAMDQDEVMNIMLMFVQASVPSATMSDLQHYRDLHTLGYLPIEFRYIAEGVSVEANTPIMLVHNTDSRFGWLVNYVETHALNEVWASCTAATVAREYRRILMHYATKTNETTAGVDYQAHDFSFRGMSSLETAVKVGLAHLFFFTGSDNNAACYASMRVYGAVPGKDFGSILASEHSVVTTNIQCVLKEMFGGDQSKRLEAEILYIRRYLKKFPTGHLGHVSDSYDFFGVLRALTELKEAILERDGTFVVRPDSGNPVHVVCGVPVELQTDAMCDIERKGTMQHLWDVFGGTINARGYKVLDSHIRLIYGDGINFERMEEILFQMEQAGFSSENIVFGIGAYSYQYVTRDTFGFAMKATYCEVEAIGEVEVYKEPKTDLGKKSHKGWIEVYETCYDFNKVATHIVGGRKTYPNLVNAMIRPASDDITDIKQYVRSDMEKAANAYYASLKAA